MFVLVQDEFFAYHSINIPYQNGKANQESEINIEIPANDFLRQKLCAKMNWTSFFTLRINFNIQKTKEKWFNKCPHTLYDITHICINIIKHKHTALRILMMRFNSMRYYVLRMYISFKYNISFYFISLFLLIIAFIRYFAQFKLVFTLLWQLILLLLLLLSHGI